jgi:hypothetical protein
MQEDHAKTMETATALTKRVDYLPAATMPQHRVSKRLDQALQKLVETGCTVEMAAKLTGYTTQGLTLALRRPHVQARKRDIVAAFMLSGTDLARVTLVNLLQSKSDDVRLRAACRLLDMAGETVQRPADTGQGSGNGDVVINVVSGYRNQINDLTDDDMETVTIQVRKRDTFNSSDTVNAIARPIEGPPAE